MKRIVSLLMLCILSLVVSCSKSDPTSDIVGTWVHKDSNVNLVFHPGGTGRAYEGLQTTWAITGSNIQIGISMPGYSPSYDSGSFKLSGDALDISGLSASGDHRDLNGSYVRK